jgi:hypothetical protein
MINKNDVKKDLYKSKNMAKFSHYVSGNLYYTVDLSFGRFQFPISTVESGWFDGEYVCGHENITMQLSSDLGTTTFENEMKGSDLNRWISKAIDNDEFIKITTGGLNFTELKNQFDEMLGSMTREEVNEWMDNKGMRSAKAKPRYCSCGNERNEGDHYCYECIKKNPFLCT